MNILKNQETIKRIDEVLNLVRTAAINNNFDFYDLQIILCLEIVKLEVLTLSKLTDKSLSALWEIWSMSAHIRYKHNGQEELYDKLYDLRFILKPYNHNMYNADLPKHGFEKSIWLKYFNVAIANLLGEK